MQNQDEIITPQFRVQYRGDGIIVYFAQGSMRQTVDAWYEMSTRHDQEAAREGRHLRRMMIFDDKFFPTPYAVSRAWAADEQTPDNLRESFAMVVENHLAFRFMQGAFSRFPIKARTNARAFNTQEAALAWLVARLDELGP